MNIILLLVSTLILLCQAEDIHQRKEGKSNTSNFRKALLEALDQLEKDEIENNMKYHDNNFDNDDLKHSDYDEDVRTKFGHKVRDNISKQETVVTSFADAGNANVFVHSFTANPLNSIIPNDKSNLEVSTAKYQLKQTSDNAISASVTSPISGKANHFSSSINRKDVTKSLPPVTPEASPTSPNPTASTSVEEEEDETKAKVEDVQFIHAPLVAAFTVEQDDKGLPHKVIPIYGNKQTVQNVIKFTNPNLQLNTQSSLEEKQKQIEKQIRILQDQKRQQEYLIQQHLLAQQQRFGAQNNVNSISQAFPKPNNNVINSFQQTFNSQTAQKTNLFDGNKGVKLHDNKNLSSQSQELSNQRSRFNIPIPTNSDAGTLSNRPTKDLSNTLVSFQSSLSFQPNRFASNNPFVNQNFQPQVQPNLQINQQEVPTKQAVNFQKAINIPISQTDNSFTLQQIPNQYRSHVFNNENNNYLQEFLYRQRTLVPPPPRGNRVFRQETQVGNFGVNNFAQNNAQQQHRFSQPLNNYNFNNDLPNARHNSFSGIQNNFNSNRHVQSQFSNNHNLHNNVDNRLQNLLYQSGLGQGHAQEDLNIVSKVLALGHTNYNKNFPFGNSHNIPFNYLNRPLTT